jgi:hypothetical protein
MQAILEKRGNRVRLVGWGVAVAIILLPLVAMQFTPEVNWGPEDFLFAIVVIGGTGLLFEFAVRLSGNPAYRGAAAVALLASLLLVWVNGAVGIVGEGSEPWNLLFAGVLVIELAGTLIAQFKARQMVWAIGATAFAQLVAAGTLAANGWGREAVLCLFWVALWAFSAGLFQAAARQEQGGA